jgi:hypothetical protein
LKGSVLNAILRKTDSQVPSVSTYFLLYDQYMDHILQNTPPPSPLSQSHPTLEVCFSKITKISLSFHLNAFQSF